MERTLHIAWNFQSFDNVGFKFISYFLLFDIFFSIWCFCKFYCWLLLKMNEDRQMEVHYVDTGFPYTVTESFMDFFEGLHQHQVPAYGNAVPLLDQVIMWPWKTDIICHYTNLSFVSWENNKYWKCTVICVSGKCLLVNEYAMLQIWSIWSWEYVLWPFAFGESPFTTFIGCWWKGMGVSYFSGECRNSRTNICAIRGGGCSRCSFYTRRM